jgi:2-C-methyl-D-erythritol 2,4-cyclodiphosphate synthase
MISKLRIGHGYDIHRLKHGGGKLVVAGVVVSDQLAAVAHSDGDVVYHSIVDAILGAMGWGDIGEHFPDTDPQWRGAESVRFVNEVCARIKQEHFHVQSLDVTLLLQQPKIRPFKQQMLENVQSHFPKAIVNIKAGTNEGVDAVGRGEAIAAHAVALLAADT